VAPGGVPPIMPGTGILVAPLRRWSHDRDCPLGRVTLFSLSQHKSGVRSIRRLAALIRHTCGHITSRCNGGER
jgi:hypothetical protein